MNKINNNRIEKAEKAISILGIAASVFLLSAFTVVAIIHPLFKVEVMVIAELLMAGFVISFTGIVLSILML